jgi:anti-sigma factor (TIGR02949 family)
VRKLTCQEVLDQLSEYLDAELQSDRANEINQHLVICDNCRFEVISLQRTILIYRRDEGAPVPTDLGERLQQALNREYHTRNSDGEEGSA